MVIHLKREIYHFKITIINIVSTKGKAGYRVWKSLGGHGDQDISLPLDFFEVFKILLFFEVEFFVANPLLIFIAKLDNNKNKYKKLLVLIKFYLTFH